MNQFNQLGLIEPLQRALATKGYTEMTPIQAQAIPPLLQGRDLLGIAQTGTGKTAAFSLPSLHRLASDPKPHHNAGCRMLVLAPTRELASQIAENMRGYARYLSLSVQCVFGGVPVGKQARALVPGCDVLVATPGRLLDLIDQRALTLRHVEILVLDEADQMMDLGFIVPLKRIANMVPQERQSLFFSATMPQAIADLGKQFIRNPVRVEVSPQSTTAERVTQSAIYLNQAEKQALLTLKLRSGLADNSIELALVFTRTKHGADRVVRHLATAGIACAAIHGNKSQAQRTAAIKGFKSGSIRVLVATDIAARGIDIPGVSHVFNFEIPNVPEQYVHRIGRTARAGADGYAESFIAPDEKPYIRDIERLTRVKLTEMPLPENFLVEAKRLPLPSRKAVNEATGEGTRPQRGPRRDGSGRKEERRDGERSRRDGRAGDARPARGHGQQPRRDDRRGDQPQRSGWQPGFGADERPTRDANAPRREDHRPRRDDAPRSERPHREARPQGSDRPQRDERRQRDDRRPSGGQPRGRADAGGQREGNAPQRRFHQRRAPQGGRQG